MSLSSLDRSNCHVLMFGGKGGVGKTTSSATTALHFAAGGRRTLIVSSDLTPSLSDIFEAQIGATETPIPGVPNLWGLEINPDEVMRRWKIKFGPEIYDAAQVLVDMPYDDLVDYVGLAPGIQEEFVLDFILDRIRGDQYDLVIWDTAPAGDTLRLLGLPYQFLEHLRVAPKMYLGVRDKLKLNKVPFLDLIASWRALSQEIAGFFRSPGNAEFILVTIAEALGVYQTERVLGELDRLGLQVRHLVVNHVITDGDCPFHRQRQAMQRPYLERLTDRYAQRLSITRVPMFADEIKGVKRLQELERALFAP
jgi:arsenite-transporting ATPase